MRVLSISALFPRPARPSFGIFVGDQMRAVAARGDVTLTLVNPVGIPPWPLSLREPYAQLRIEPARSDGPACRFRSAEVRHGRSRHTG
jgi:hypothetical protein